MSRELDLIRNRVAGGFETQVLECGLDNTRVGKKRRTDRAHRRRIADEVKETLSRRVEHSIRVEVAVP